jgi:threonylcarbamoyladenosine tRNA methylthiotransferase MtaB
VAASFHIENFGCRAARADGETIAEQLQHCMQQTSDVDLIIVNTCSVTAEADRAARAYIRRAHRKNPAARIVATGCYAQRAPEELAGLAGVVAVVGNSHKALVPEIALGLALGRDEMEPRLVSVGSLMSGSGSAKILADDRFAHSFLEEAQAVPGAQTRPNLKIQEGCGNRCSFCVIPQTRGLSRSLPGETVLRQVEGFVAAGGKELVFSGINLGRWGRDFSFRKVKASEETWSPTPSAVGSRKEGARESDGAPRSLAGLVRQIFERTDLARLRLSSIEPMDWDAELIGLMAEFGGGRLARHAHLPLQSGSDAVLRRMHRRYRPWHYAEKVAALLKAAGPNLTLGADVMVGFPGETDAEFEETLNLVRALPFGYLHLFPFSPRPATRAWALHKERPVRQDAVEERMSALRTLAAEKSLNHRTGFIGRQLDAITLHSSQPQLSRGCAAALTENFLPVELKGEFAANRLVRVQVTGIHADKALLAVACKSSAAFQAAEAAD